MNYKDLKRKHLFLLEELTTLREEIFSEGNATFERWKPNIDRKVFSSSAMNLAYYLALRRRDIRDIQDSLMSLGLSSLGRSESRVLSNLDLVIFNLSKIIGKNEYFRNQSLSNSYFFGRRMLERNSKRIFGNSDSNRYTNVMVTIPTEAANDYPFIQKLILNGMNVARINCAHDNEEVWSNMIHNIRRAEKELNKNCKILMDIAGPKARIDWLLTTVKHPKLSVGDAFIVTGEKLLHRVDGMDFVCGCTIPEIESSLNEGDSVLIDDGMIEGHVETINDDGVVVRIDKMLKKNMKLKVGKGLNFPRSKINMNILSDKDKKDLDFICGKADIIGFSFIKDAQDIAICQKEIEKRVGENEASAVSIMAKIETLSAVQHLPEIIVTGASKNPFCVMIARGDLAVETGYLRLAELQEEILCICEAAHVPVIWATQVLEGMVKTGIPSRAEITDVSMGSRAECIMLNKGDSVLHALETLDKILINMQEQQYKKTPRLRSLSIAKEDLITT